MAFIFLFLLSPFSASIKNFIEINSYALNVSKNLLRFESPADLENLENRIIDVDSTCHVKWLSWVYYHYGNKNEDYQDLVIELLNCSRDMVNLFMLYDPNNKALSMKSVELYPDFIPALYWSYFSLTEDQYDQKRILLEKIVSIKPIDGYAWSRLGYLYEFSNSLDQSLFAFIKACDLGDVGNHGCFGAGRILEQRGAFPEAINYYKKSKHIPAIQAAERLEAELSSQVP